MATILITGGTGLIGKALSASLVKNGYDVIILTRDPSAHKPEEKIRYAHWNLDKQQIDQAALAAADHIVHLAGAGVADKRWTESRKKEIVDSRVKSGQLLVKVLKENKNNVQSVISSSAIGWYGPDPLIPNPRPFIEEDKPDTGFLGETCLKWEESVTPLKQLGKRLVILRTGIVLSKEGGALKEFRKPVKFGVAAILGSGKQMISWIHIEDLVRLYIRFIEHASLEGIYNAVAPKPVSNSELVTKLAKELKGSFYVPMHVPAFVLKMALGEMSIEVLKSATVSCVKVHLTDFTYQYPTIDAALPSLK
ncbi:TIGR01777 family oxidoreductase [Terrimonas sp. NA20]|uniref:TIGR01777 family oxidoreductase n=1 Tax=Terrimonas ginsenosidimutans TaxID=2908004 RepID=A0ABS9KW37_9BACT|nr:TIGR01777 family oxidoreductase [Terrimonas ginsenosidimutans]MCG2616498.1 TIGR01777 family oxidoreductase [Terrimonas ginsenosidimutans]